MAAMVPGSTICLVFTPSVFEIERNYFFSFDAS